MSAGPRFLFDECVGKPVMERIQALVQSDATFAHIVDYYAAGALDAEWIPRLAEEGRWIVITSDGGKQSRRGEKLPDLCSEYRITHVILSSTLHHSSSRTKAGALTSLWTEIEALAAFPPGTRFLVRYKPEKGKKGLAALSLVLEQRPPIIEAETKRSTAAEE